MAHVDTIQLAEFIFLKNNENKLIHIEVDGIKETKDMFMFCIELLNHGLQFLTREPLSLDDMSIELFEKVQERLRLAGIEVNVEVTLHGVQKMSNDSNTFSPESGLEKHHMILKTSKATYDVWFRLIRNVQN